MSTQSLPSGISRLHIPSPAMFHHSNITFSILSLSLSMSILALALNSCPRKVTRSVRISQYAQRAQSSLSKFATLTVNWSSNRLTDILNIHED